MIFFIKNNKYIFSNILLQLYYKVMIDHTLYLSNSLTINLGVLRIVMSLK